MSGGRLPLEKTFSNCWRSLRASASEWKRETSFRASCFLASMGWFSLRDFRELSDSPNRSL